MTFASLKFFLMTLMTIAEMNEVYGKWLDDVEIPPARAAFEAANLPRGAKVEIVIQAISPE